MNRLMTLLSIEAKRILKPFFMALLIYMVAVIIDTYRILNSIMNSLEAAAALNVTRLQDMFINHGDTFLYFRNLVVGMGSLNIGLVLLIGSVLFYSLNIWYKEWRGSDKSIYTLLTLPIDRMNVYLAKLITIVLMFLSIASAYIINLIIIYKMAVKILPPELANTFTFNEMVGYSRLVLWAVDLKGTMFLTMLAAIALCFLICFSERSFRLKGLMISSVAAIVIVFINLLIIYSSYLLYIEKKIMLIVLQLLTIAISMLISRYLLINKVSL